MCRVWRVSVSVRRTSTSSLLERASRVLLRGEPVTRRACYRRSLLSAGLLIALHTRAVKKCSDFPRLSAHVSLFFSQAAADSKPLTRLDKLSLARC